VDDLVIDAAAGKVAVRWTATGTHQGKFLGVEPTGRRVVFRGIEIVHIEDGLIIERWGEWDGIARWQHLTKRAVDRESAAACFYRV
jgi:predicted ester cyclase